MIPRDTAVYYAEVVMTNCTRPGIVIELALIPWWETLYPISNEILCSPPSNDLI